MRPIVAFVNYSSRPAPTALFPGVHRRHLFGVIDFASDETTSQFLKRRNRILATGKQAIVHLIEATRKPNYVVGLIIVLIAAAETALIVREPAAKVQFKRANIPEPNNIAGLRSINHLGVGQQCPVPAVESAAEWRILTGPDAFSILMPRPWQRTALDTTTLDFHDPTATFSDRRDNYLRVSRVATGAAGRSWIANETPTADCEVSDGTAGSIWLFYTLRLDKNDFRYKAFGDAVTSGGRRYKLDVSTWSRTNRDSLVAIASKAILKQ